MLIKMVFLISIFVITSCGSVSNNSIYYSVLKEQNLPAELKETSGLYCPDVGSAYTVNDSGNNPIIYKIDNSGRILSLKVVSTKNTDWEALTGDKQNFYIGDVGNNSGQRKFVQIHAVPKTSGINVTDVETSSLSYANNVISKNKYLDHDFDAETLINVDDSLFLFSKSWDTGTLFVYQLNKFLAKQSLKHISEIKGLPGTVTGGDFDYQNNRFILVGYELNGFGGFYPFIAILNRNLTLLRTFPLSGFGQVEGLCVVANGEVWLTQERSLFSTNKLVKLKITE